MHEFVIDKCELMLESISAIENYLREISTAADFKKSLPGEMSFDAVLMRLQSIGENIKQVNKIDNDFFNIHLQFDTNSVVRFRDLNSHHYEKLDTEIVFEICTIDIPDLKQKIKTFLSNNEAV